jgi:hypothetical protein
MLIKQVGLDQVADDAETHRAPGAEHLDKAQLEEAGFGGAQVTAPFTADSLAGMRDVLDSPANQLLTDIMMGKQDWASVTRHKQNGAVVYIMIAGGCVSTWTKTPSGEVITSHTDTRAESIDQVLKSVCGECHDILKSQWGFTSSIQVLRNNYPNSYAELAKEMERKLEEQGDEE